MGSAHLLSDTGMTLKFLDYGGFYILEASNLSGDNHIHIGNNLFAVDNVERAEAGDDRRTSFDISGSMATV